MKTNINITAAAIPIILVCLLAGCATSTIPEDVADERLIDVGLPFERGMMAYIRGDEDRARIELQSAVDTNHQDLRASYLLCHLDDNDCYKQSKELAQESEAAAPAIESVEQYLALVEGRSPRMRSAVYSIVERKMILEQKQYGIGPVLNVMLRFYPEAIFAMLTQRLVELVEYPTEMSRQNAMLLQQIATYVDVKNDVLTSAFDSYVDYGTALQQIHALRAELAAREHTIRITQLLIESGYTAKLALVEAEAKRDKTLQQLQSVEISALSYLERMAVLAGIRPEQLSDLTVQHLALPDAEETPALRTTELDAIANQQYFDSLDVSDTISVLSLTKVNLFASYGKNYTDERETFVKGWATGVRFQVPLMIWPMGNARIAQQDAIIGQFETELEYSLIQARSNWLNTYKRFTETSNLYTTARSDTALRLRRLESQEAARQAGAPQGRLKSIQAYISYYRSLYREYEAASRQQKAAFKWFRAQALSSQDIRFSASDLSLADTCQAENRYVYPPARTLEISNIGSFTDADEALFLAAFTNYNDVRALVVPVSPELLLKHGNSYRALLTKFRSAGVPVLARLNVRGDDKPSALENARTAMQAWTYSEGKKIRFDGIKVVFSDPFAAHSVEMLEEIFADYPLPVVVELELRTVATASPEQISALVAPAHKLSIFLDPGDAPDATDLLDKLGPIAEKTYFTIDLGAYERPGSSGQLQARGMGNLVQENCQLFNQQRGLRELGIYSFEAYMALMHH